MNHEDKFNFQHGGHLEVVKLLLFNGADPNSCDNSSSSHSDKIDEPSPIQKSFFNVLNRFSRSSKAVVEPRREEKKKEEPIPPQYPTPIENAIVYGNVSVVVALLKAGNTFVFHCCFSTFIHAFYKGASLDPEKMPFKELPLSLAAEQKRLDIVELLLRYSPSIIRHQMPSSKSPLISACDNNGILYYYSITINMAFNCFLDFEMLQLLLKFAQNTTDSELLHHAALKGDPKIIRIIVDLTPESLRIDSKPFFHLNNKFALIQIK